MNTSALQARFYELRSNKIFETFVIAVIIFSALVIGAKTYDIPAPVLQLIIWTDILITLFFLVELSIRYLGEPNKREFFKSAWNLFDTLIVVVSLIPIEDSELALIGRLVRIFRVLRMVSMVPELRTLLNSLLIALPRLGYVVLLMFIIFYIYGAIGAFFFADINATLWGDITVAMLTLFRVMTFEDWTDVMYETMAVHGFSWFYYLSFIFLTTFAFLNMVIGIVVSVMEDEHAKERAAKAAAANEPTLQDLSQQVAELKQMLETQHKRNSDTMDR
ncbi:ion transporter [Pontibacter sp. JAM-7]|uniref:ion transporter n=1 Tax=Pontibacter sp. JAM-7 TaxID=3366581 RepID=UPI003AF702B9